MSKEAQTRLSQQMAEGMNADGRIERRVGNDEIYLVNRQLGKKLVRFAFAAHETYGSGQLQRGKDQAICNQLWHNIRDAQREARCAPDRPSPQHIAHFPPARENLVSVLKSNAAGFCKDKIPALLLKELDSNRLLETADLLADRGLSEQ